MLAAIPEAELPQPVSDNVESCLSLSLGKLSSNTEMMVALDAISDAMHEVNTARSYVGYLIPQVQSEMRRMERLVAQENPGVKVTPLERILKTTERHVILEMEMGKLVSVRDYCDKSHEILESKAFTLRMLLKSRYAS